MILLIRSLVSIVLALASPLAPTVRASADEDEVYSAPTVRVPHPINLEAPAHHKRFEPAVPELVIDLGPLSAEEEIPQRARKRRRIGIHRPLPSEFTGNLVLHLDWTADARTTRHTAAITFRADGAVSLRIAVQATLPLGASVQVFDGNGQPCGPAFTQADFNDEENEPVWLPSAEGDTLTAQIVLPSAEAVEALSFSVTSVAHRFESVTAKSHSIFGGCPGDADMCGENQIVQDVAQAVGRMLFEDAGSSYVCVGTILNAIPNPFPEILFLTANHCVPTHTVASSVEVFVFNRGGCFEFDDYGYFNRPELLATSSAQDATLLRFAIYPGLLPDDGLTLAGWATNKISDGASVFSVNHLSVSSLPSAVFPARYSEGQVQRTWERVDVTSGFDGDSSPVYNAIEVDWSRGLTEAGASGAGLFVLGQEGYLIGVLSGGEGNCSAEGDIFGSFRDFFPLVRQWLGPASSLPDPEPETFTHMLPAVPGTGGDVEGFVRITNDSDIAGEIKIYAIDDAGHRYGPVSFSIDAKRTRHFNSYDLEYGAPSKGLFGGVGDGTGMWRLELETTLKVGAKAYIRTPDSFVTSMHQVAEEVDMESEGSEADYGYYVPFFNPGSNTAIRSLLRVINPNPFEVDVRVVGFDDDYDYGGPVRFTLAPNNAMQISAQALEQGDAAFAGSLGTGTGKWSISVVSTDPIHVMSLLSTASGHLTNLSR